MKIRIIWIFLLVVALGEYSATGTDSSDSMHNGVTENTDRPAFKLLEAFDGDLAEGYEITLRHLMYKKRALSSRWKANKKFPGYHVFLNGHKSKKWKDRSAQHIFLSEIWRPPVEDIENVVFLSAGQQGSSFDRMDFSSIVTGQRKNWHKKKNAKWFKKINSWKYLKNKTVNIKWRSIAGQIMTDAYLNDAQYFGMTPHNTYLVVVFDACFYFSKSKSKKKKRLEDYLQWLTYRLEDNRYDNIKNIYLAGASRGGALVCRMAYEMKTSAKWRPYYGHINIIVSSFDGVCNKNQGELFTLPENVDNPENPFFLHCYKSFLHAYVKDIEGLHLFQIAGGALVFPIPGNPRAFYIENYEDTLKFKWVNRRHKDIGRNWNNDVCVAHLHWLQKWLQ